MAAIAAPADLEIAAAATETAHPKLLHPTPRAEEVSTGDPSPIIIPTETKRLHPRGDSVAAESPVSSTSDREPQAATTPEPVSGRGQIPRTPALATIVSPRSAAVVSTFEVRRSAKRRQVSLVVQPGYRGVLVLAPARTSLERLAEVVRRRGAWAVSKLRLVELAERPARPREFVSGEGFTYLGRSFRLSVKEVPEANLASPRLDRGWLEVRVRRGLSASARRRAVRAGLIAWFRERAAARLPERLARFTAKLEVSGPRLLLRDQARRWGSCNEKGEARINWRIIQAPMVLVDYVVAHEAVHLRHRNHTRTYWTELGRLIGDVERSRAELRRRGSQMVW